MPRTMSDHILSHGGDLPSGMTAIRPTARRRRSTQRERERERRQRTKRWRIRRVRCLKSTTKKDRERKPFWDNKSLF